MFGVLTLFLAVVLVVRAIGLTRREHRLTAAEASLLDPGNRQSERRTEGTGMDGDPITHVDYVYVAQWEFTVRGRSYRGQHVSDAPVFQRKQAIRILYDPEDPSVSRLDGDATTGKAKPWFIASGVVAALGVVLLLAIPVETEAPRRGPAPEPVLQPSPLIPTPLPEQTAPAKETRP